MHRRGDRSLILVARAERKKEKREKIIAYTLLFVGVFTTFFLLLFLAIDNSKITGEAIDSQGGYITELDIEQTFPVEIWSGFYGLALRVDGFEEAIFEAINAGTIERVDAFFDCLDLGATGGPEIYASTASSLDFSSVTIGDLDAVDSLIGCSDKEYCANNTFTNNMSIYVGGNEVDGIPSTHTFRFDGINEIFDIGVLNISGELAFVAHINSTIQKGFSPNVTVNYQMLLPTPANTSQTFYFYPDPNDNCPPGGIGNSINASLWGYTFDQDNNVLENVTVTVAGYSDLSNNTGFYNTTFLVLPGTYSVIAQKTGYEPYIGNVTVNFTDFYIHQNISLSLTTTEPSEIVTPHVSGRVTDVAGGTLSGVTIALGNDTTETDSNGLYSFYPTVVLGENPFFGTLTGYDNYVTTLNFTVDTTSVSHNFSMEAVNENTFPSGPDPDEGDSDLDNVAEFKTKAEELGQDFWIAPDKIDVQVRKNTFIEVEVAVYNFKSGRLNVAFELDPDLEDFIRLDKNSLSIARNNFDVVTLTILGTKPLGVYEGVITLSGGIDQEIPVKVEVVDRKLPVETLLMEIDLLRKVVRPGADVRYKLSLQNLLNEQSYIVNLKHQVVNEDDLEVYVEEEESVEILNSLSLIKRLELPDDIPEGEYIVSVSADYLNLFSGVTAPFTIAQLFIFYSFFGIPLWIIFVIIAFLSFILFSLFMYRLQLRRKRRFRIALDINTLPKPGPRAIKIGKIAERKEDAWYNMDAFTTHGIVAGATGGGKSISAQVFVEEMLKKNIAVIVFDPTAQWSGMLRKCEDKKMLSFYPKFGLKPSDAQAFPGNVRQVVNERQKIEVEKHVRPGQIQIFTLNKLEPSKMDTFVAGVIAQIFRSDPKEHPNLRVLLVFDEVHRLLPRFGGKGAGFLQIERACREFRKWGYGVMLVSQVLSDFVGEIKANINTEVQMRVAEERDLERIRERYGLDALKSLVRAGVGTGMIQNAEYNRGRPYFVNFRPILHNTRRLSDEILEKYNEYSDKIDDLEYQIEQLEKEKVDTFDLKMELKLVKDKLMTGNFTVVDIYLEGLEPRIASQWENLGKKPKERKIELISEEEVLASLEAAKKERAKWEKKNAPVAGGEEKKEEKKVDKLGKLVKAFTFDNGIMISSLRELKDVLPNLDDDILSSQKAALGKWAGETNDPGLGKKISASTNKDELGKILDAFEKGEKPKEEKKESKKAGGKANEGEKKKPDKNEKPKGKPKVSLQKLKKKDTK